MFLGGQHISEQDQHSHDSTSTEEQEESNSATQADSDELKRQISDENVHFSEKFEFNTEQLFSAQSMGLITAQQMGESLKAKI